MNFGQMRLDIQAVSLKETVRISSVNLLSNSFVFVYQDSIPISFRSFFREFDRPELPNFMYFYNAFLFYK